MSSLARFKLGFLIILFLIAFGSLGVERASAKDQFIAVVITGDLPRYKQAHEAFVKVLRAGGLTEDRVQIYVQTPNPDQMSWANSIRKAVGIGADLIVTYGAPVTLTAKREARDTPVLFADVYDPVGVGIVKALAVPGGDITGVSGKTPLPTLIKNFVEVKTVRTMGVVYNKEDEGSMQQINELRKLSGKYGINLVTESAETGKEVGKALARLPDSLDALFISESPILHLEIDKIMAFAKNAKVPVLSQIPGLCDKGALMTLEADPQEQGQLAGVHALQILSGQRARTLPVRTPKKVAMVVNLHVAQDFGLTVPFQVLSMATRVIK